MAKSVRFKWDIKGFQKLRRSAEVKARLKKEADSVAQSAGDGYEVNVGEGKTRSRASVVTATPEAIRNESKNSSLLRAFSNRGA